jgi:shikimate 5-dehydrogenase
MNRPFEADFGALFPERKPFDKDDFDNVAVAGRRVLITGAGGSIGSALARRILRASPQRLTLVDRSEQALRGGIQTCAPAGGKSVCSDRG